MNFYEKHIGDYTADTVGLTMLEDGAYNRLLDVYYKTERPLPADKSLVYRVARATSAAEKKAVSFVLEHHFILTDDGYSHKRVEEEIAKFNAKKPQADAKRENEKERQRRARERRKALFEQLSSHGINMPWNASTEQLLAEIVHIESRASHTPVTRDESNPVTRDNTANQSPVPIHQYSKAAATTVPTSQADPPAHAAPPGSAEIPDAATSRAAQLAMLLRRNGADPRILPNDRHIADWARDGVTDAQVLLALETAKQRRKDQGSEQPIGTAYLAPIITEALAPPSSRTAPRAPADDWYRTDAGTDRKGRELGLAARGGESYGSYRDRIWQRIRELKQGPERPQQEPQP